MANHGTVNWLSRLPPCADMDFETLESAEDYISIFKIKVKYLSIQNAKPLTLFNLNSQDPCFRIFSKTHKKDDKLEILQIVDKSFSGWKRKKNRLARSLVDFPSIDKDTVDLCHHYQVFDKFNNRLPPPPYNPLEVSIASTESSEMFNGTKTIDIDRYMYLINSLTIRTMKFYIEMNLSRRTVNAQFITKGYGHIKDRMVESQNL
ncbi:hypothetical protein RF11_11754 [Thelohanellus kitauei]|uniref:Uncharacterized protein n=1 Tax=Thelohanellus kitauei TaxID=669202 RepID=A0A0C2MV73_THEKT|nr:hypothetical protein RF11_11754 [Thelohanellus kitauei]